jgi:hypothetical protein
MGNTAALDFVHRLAGERTILVLQARRALYHGLRAAI